MTDAEQEKYRQSLAAELAELSTDEAARAGDRAPVELDQQSVGRLSRMDAMQQQAMARATSERRRVRKLRISAALMRLDTGEFGFCTDCGENIPTARLDQDPSVPRCISCSKG